MKIVLFIHPALLFVILFFFLITIFLLGTSTGCEKSYPFNIFNISSDSCSSDEDYFPTYYSTQKGNSPRGLTPSDPMIKKGEQHDCEKLQEKMQIDHAGFTLPLFFIRLFTFPYSLRIHIPSINLT